MASEMPQDPPAPMLDAEVPSYVQPYGYTALGPLQWQELTTGAARPTLSLKIVGHTEIEDHTFYQVKCGLEAPPNLSLKWRVARRLVHLREGLHDVLQGSLGEGYDAVFGEARFARRGGPPGTSARLEAWLDKLADHVNDGRASPATVALVLNFCEAPKPPTGATARALLDFVDVAKPSDRASSPFAAELSSPSAPASRKALQPGSAGLAFAASPASRKVSFAASPETATSPGKGHPVFTA